MSEFACPPKAGLSAEGGDLRDLWIAGLKGKSDHPIIGRISIQTKEGMNKYRQYRKRFYMESANRVGGALTRLMQSKGECKKLSESGLAGLMDKPCTVAYSLRGRLDE